MSRDGLIATGDAGSAKRVGPVLVQTDPSISKVRLGVVCHSPGGFVHCGISGDRSALSWNAGVVADGFPRDES